LTCYGQFRAFSRGPLIRTYSGDIAAEHEKEAEKWRAFLNHPLKPPSCATRDFRVAEGSGGGPRE
jgi:hypothetical protein